MSTTLLPSLGTAMNGLSTNDWMEKVMHLTTFPLSASISPNPDVITYGDGEKKNVKKTCKYCKTNLYSPYKKHYLTQKREKNPT